MRNPTNTRGRGVVVLGMHRSGTSAVAGLLHFAGVPLPDPRHLVRSDRFNTKGFWEIQPLNLMNESLFRAFGGEWSAPPSLPEGWHESPTAQRMRRRGSKAFTSIMPTDGWLWKDPRLCLTLPFWKSVLDQSPVVFLVLRNPLEVSQSLQRRNGFSHRLSLALWERYTAAAAASAAGSTVEVIEYQSVMEDPLGWRRRARAWLEEQGVRPRQMATDDTVRSFIDPSLRHARSGLADLQDDPDVSDGQAALLAGLLARTGHQEHFSPPELPQLTPWASALLDERRPLRLAELRHHRWRRAAARQAARIVRVRKYRTTPGVGSR
jgi:hypothetical protein